VADVIRATRARKRQRIAIVVMALAAVGAVILAVYNGVEHRWGSMAGNILVAIGLALGLLARRQISKQQAGQSRPS